MHEMVNGKRTSFKNWALVAVSGRSIVELHVGARPRSVNALPSRQLSFAIPRSKLPVRAKLEILPSRSRDVRELNPPRPENQWTVGAVQGEIDSVSILHMALEERGNTAHVKGQIVVGVLGESVELTLDDDMPLQEEDVDGGASASFLDAMDSRRPMYDVAVAMGAAAVPELERVAEDVSFEDRERSYFRRLIAALKAGKSLPKPD